MSRSMARETAFKSIYSQLFMVDRYMSDDIKDEMYEGLTESDDLDFVAKILTTFAENYTNINDIIAKNIRGYAHNRIFKIDLAIVSVAICELFYLKNEDKAVIINESVKLAKKYSTEKSPSFINGFLASICQEENKE